MTESQYKEIREFTQRLSIKRQQVSDGELLNACQQHLQHLLDLIKAKRVRLDPDPRPKVHRVEFPAIGRR